MGGEVSKTPGRDFGEWNAGDHDYQAKYGKKTTPTKVNYTGTSTPLPGGDFGETYDQPHGKYNTHSPMSPRSYVSKSSKSSDKWYDYLTLNTKNKKMHTIVLIINIILLIFAVYTSYVYYHSYTSEELKESTVNNKFILWIKQNIWFLVLLWIIVLCRVVFHGFKFYSMFYKK